MTDQSVEALRLTAYDLLASRVADGVAESKRNLADSMAVTDRKAVVVPVDGEQVKVATVSYVSGRAGDVKARIEDLDAFIEWARQDNPDAVRMVPVVLPWFEQEALHRAQVGEVIPGIEMVETDPGKPYIRIQRDKSPEATAALVDAIFQEGVDGVRSLLAIEPPVES